MTAVPRLELEPGYSIARVITGCWQLAAGHGGTSGGRNDTIGRFRRLIDHGFTTFDCADIYTGVEELLGRLVDDLRRTASIEIHTKYVPDLDSLPNLRRQDVARTIDRSLSRLRVERLDLVQFHWWDYEIPGWLEAAGWLDELRRAGKIRCLGATNFDTKRLGEILAAGVPVLSHQVQYSLLDRRPEPHMVDLARRYGVRLLTYGSLAGGFLSDRYLGRPSPPTPLANRSLVKYRLIVQELGGGERGWAALQEVLGALRTVAFRHRVSVAQVATRWVLERPAVGAVIVGLGGRDRLDERLGVFGFELDERDRDEIDRLLARYPGPAGDVYELERVPAGAHYEIMKRNLNRDRPAGEARA